MLGFCLFCFTAIFNRENSIDDYCHNNHCCFLCMGKLLVCMFYCFSNSVLYINVIEKNGDCIPTEIYLGVSMENKSLRHLKLDTSMN